jgi:alkylhydroperoxidase family enzyme
VTGPRVPPVDPARPPAALAELFAQQVELYGAPLNPTLVMAHCPELVRGARGLGIALEKSGQLSPELRDLVSLRVAQLIGCPF